MFRSLAAASLLFICACATTPVTAQEDDLRGVFQQAAERAGIAEEEVRVLTLRWVSAGEAVEILRKVVGGEGVREFGGGFGGDAASGGPVMHADARTNSIIAKATPDALDEIAALLQRIDAPTDTSSMRVEVTVWEIHDHDGRFDRAVAREFDSALPVERPRRDINEKIIPELARSGYLAHPVELRATAFGEQPTRMASGYRRPVVETVQGEHTAYTFQELGTVVELVARKVGNQFLIQMELSDEREAQRPEEPTALGSTTQPAATGTPEPPTMTSTQMATTLRIRNDAAEVHLIGGAGRERGVRLMVVIAVSDEEG